MTTVMCFGTFDGLHPGHEDYFRQAREIGERVVVVVARDQTVVDVKGQLPATNETDRLASVAAHPHVDEAYLGSHGSKYDIIEQLKPHILLLGYDQQTFTDQLEEEMKKRGVEAEIRRATPFQPEIYKSSKLRPAPSVEESGEELF